VNKLWQDQSIQLAWEACRNYQIQVSHMDYFMNNIDRITGAKFVPTDEDIIRARQRTAGAHVTRFFNSKYVWELIDVGGQAPERTKWLNIVEQQQTDLSSIVYFAALDEYNMESSEEPGKTKMEVSLNVFSEVMNDAVHYDKCTILFLNKTDLFRDKIESKKGYKEFKEKFTNFETWMDTPYTEEEGGYKAENSGEDEPYSAALKYIELLFREKCPAPGKLVVYSSCAIDTDQVDIVFTTMRDYIFVQRMANSGIVF